MSVGRANIIRRYSVPADERDAWVKENSGHCDYTTFTDIIYMYLHVYRAHKSTELYVCGGKL